MNTYGLKFYTRINRTRFNLYMYKLITESIYTCMKMYKSNLWTYHFATSCHLRIYIIYQLLFIPQRRLMEVSTQPPPDFWQFPDSQNFRKSWSQDLSFADLLILSFGVRKFTFRRLQVFNIVAKKYMTNISHESFG